MNVNVCNNCGNVAELRGGSLCCPFCGSVTTDGIPPKAQNMLSSAFLLLGESNFDGAKTAFENIIQKYPACAEAYFGRLRARYQITYRELADGRLSPKCATRSGANIAEDVDYRKAVEYASEEYKAFLQAQAEAVTSYCTENRLSKNISVKFTLGEVDPNDEYQIKPKRSKKPIVISGVAFFFVLVIAIAAAFAPEKNHTHEPGNWVTVRLAEKRTEGLKELRCIGCDYVFESETVPAIVSDDLVFGLNADGTYSVKNIGTCQDTEIVIPATYKGEPVTAIDARAFRYCAGVTSIDIPEGVTAIGNHAFFGCGDLTDITIPDGVTSIGNEAFYGCGNLKTVDIPDSVTSIGSGAFNGCGRLKAISVHENNAYYCSKNGVLFNKAKTELLCYPARKTGTTYSIPEGVTSIVSYAFEGCNNLASIAIPEGVTSIVSYAFTGCGGLKIVTIPDSVTSIGSCAFRDCGNLTSVTIPDSVTSIGESAFRDCKSLTGIIIPEGVTGIGNYAFSGCTGLTGITISAGVKNIGVGTFSGCSSLTSVRITDGVTGIGDSAFEYCGNLTSVEIPVSVKSVGDWSFAQCKKLTSINFGGTVAQWNAITFGSDWRYNTGTYTVTCTDGSFYKK